jgi:hypothetical protein
MNVVFSSYLAVCGDVDSDIHLVVDGFLRAPVKNFFDVIGQVGQIFLVGFSGV